MAKRKRYKRHGNLKGKRTNKRYEGMRRSGVPKQIAAATANKMKTKKGRKSVGRSSARSRRRGRRRSR
jgi:hypothetical protein